MSTHSDKRQETPASLKALLNGDMKNWIAASTPGGIEAQEAAGQQMLCNDSTVPIDCPRKELEELGIVFGEPVDKYFVRVMLPAGWKKVPTSHAMWSDLVDENGKKIASIFYKAAFYDQRAHMCMERPEKP